MLQRYWQRCILATLHDFKNMCGFCDLCFAETTYLMAQDTNHIPISGQRWNIMHIQNGYYPCEEHKVLTESVEPYNQLKTLSVVCVCAHTHTHCIRIVLMTTQKFRGKGAPSFWENIGSWPSWVWIQSMRYLTFFGKHTSYMPLCMYLQLEPLEACQYVVQQDIQKKLLHKLGFLEQSPRQNNPSGYQNP